MLNLLQHFFGISMALCFALSSVPQIVKIFKSKSSQNVSIGLIVLIILGYICGLTYMFLTTFIFWIAFSQIIGLVINIFLLIAWFKFKK